MLKKSPMMMIAQKCLRTLWDHQITHNFYKLTCTHNHGASSNRIEA